MLIAPNSEFHALITQDIRTNNEWHEPSTHPSSWYLKNLVDWYALGPDLIFFSQAYERASFDARISKLFSTGDSRVAFHGMW